LEYLLPHTGPAREAIFEEVDAVALYHYKLKIAHEEAIRKRFGTKNDISVAEEEAAHELVDSVIGQMSLGELMQADAGEIDGDSEEGYTSSEDESSSVASEQHATTGDGKSHTSSPPTSPSKDTPPSPRPGSSSGKARLLVNKLDSLHKRSHSDDSSASKAASLLKRKKKGGTRLKEPELRAIPDLLPLFLELVRPRLQAKVKPS